MKVLQSVRVVEIGGIGPGPFCGMHLADLGADVITILRPESSPARAQPSILARGKRTVFADLKHPDGQALVLALAQHADALIEGMRPGVMERLGLGPQALHQVNEKLVYARMTGWGQSGPLASSAGHDTNYVAVSGALWGSSPADARPVSPFAVLGDIAGGALYLMTGLLAGIIQARQNGRGTVVDAAITDGSAHMLNLMLSARQNGLLDDTRGGSIHDSSPFYETYACADGRFITLGAIEPQFYALLLRLLQLENVPAFQGGQWDKAAWPARRAHLQALFASQGSAHWQKLLENTDACFGLVHSPLEAAQHPHMAARGTYRHDADTPLQAVPAPRFDGVAYPVNPARASGADTHDVCTLVAQGRAQDVWHAR